MVGAQEFIPALQPPVTLTRGASNAAPINYA